MWQWRKSKKKPPKQLFSSSPIEAGQLCLPLLNVHVQPLLDYEEGGVRLELLVRMQQLEPVVSQKPRKHLVDLQKGEVPTDAHVGTAAELHVAPSAGCALPRRGKREKRNRNWPYLEHVSLHPPRTLFVFCPPLGPEQICVLPKHGLIAMKDPAVDGNARAAGEEMAIQFDTLRGHVTSNVDAHGRPDPHGFLEAGLEVGEALALGPRDVTSRRDRARFDGGIDFLHQLLVDPAICQDMPEERLHGGSCRVGPGEAT